MSVPTNPNAGASAEDGDPSLVVLAGARAPANEPLQDPAQVKGVLRRLERGFLHLDRWIGLAVPEPLNPLLHTGAIAVTSLLIATATGIILLLWYQPSVHLAYESVSAMSLAPWTAGFMRSLHRYSSDLCMFFGLVHAIRYFLARRFIGPQWLAWVTGLATMATLWFVGWTGYWLVWDVRAQYVALGTARVVDALPIFADPLSRSFITDEGVNSLLFFVVFFFHMLVPLAMGVVLWLHITRLSRARFLTRKPLTIWVCGLLLLLCVAYPATSAAPAEMAALSVSYSMDWWYLVPLVLTDRLSGGMLWASLLVSSVVLFSIPWWLGGRPRQVANVIASRCNSCMKCYQDCPYGAISMVPRTDGSDKFPTQASIDPAKCVGCGICAGSCDTAGVGVDWFGAIDQRRRIEAWLEQAVGDAAAPVVAFVCAESAGGDLVIDPATGLCDDLPGYRVLRVPCAGWVHPLLIERAIRHGASGALVVSCGPGECHYREGGEWIGLRLDGVREPVLRVDKVPRDRVRLLALDRTRAAKLIREAQIFCDGAKMSSAIRHSPVLTGLAAAVIAAIFAAPVGLLSDLSYAAPRVEGSELVVSFKHPGQLSENCRKVSAAELAKMPVHMRREEVCERARSAVRLRVMVDGAQSVEVTVPPSGIWSDGNSVAVERISVRPGEHSVEVAIGDSADPDEWRYLDRRTLEFSEDARRVVVFDRVAGFSWH